MKILFIAPLPPPITGHSLAAEVFLRELVKHHKVEVVNLSKDSLEAGVNSFKRIAEVVFILREVWRKKKEADIVYLTISESLAGNIKDLLIYAICFRSLSRMYIHLHGGSIKKLLWDRHKTLLAINGYFIKKLAGVIVLGQSHLCIFESLIAKEKMHIVPNFAQDYLFLSEKEILDKFSCTQPLRILFISNFIQEKGFNELVDAYFALDGNLKKMVMIDFAGSFESEFQEKVFLDKIAGLEQIRYHGVVDGIEKKVLFSRAHVFCLPTSFFEGQPVSILEAYASGCVVLTTGQSGIRDIFTHGVNGFEVQERSANSIKLVLESIVGETENLRQIAISNRKMAGNKYRTSIYHCSLREIIESPVTLSANSDSPSVTAMTNVVSPKRDYAICTNCIMDTTDSDITFDERGWCDYCNNYYQNILPNWHPNEVGERLIAKDVDEIKRHGKGRDHDCLIGISGGVDSSYVTYLAKEKFGLRPLLFHVDAGWNSQQAVNNVERLVDGLRVDLHTEVVDWLEMQDLQLAFFKAQVPHLDTPQDHAFFAALYNFAAKHGFKYILTGANYSTECVREPLEWHYHASDLRQLKDIHRQFGKRPLKTFPTADIFTYKLYYRYVKGVRVVKPLNYVPYVKEEAMQELVDRFGWQKYAHKHYESRFTRFYEGYWLPTKFGYDKRRAHFSSLILTKQMTREEALKRISKPAYDESTIAQDFEYIATKLDVSVAELQALLHGPNKSYRDYKNSMGMISAGTKVLRVLGIQRAIIR